MSASAPRFGTAADARNRGTPMALNAPASDTPSAASGTYPAIHTRALQMMHGTKTRWIALFTGCLW